MELLKKLESVKFNSDNLLNIKPDEIDRSLLCMICQEILKIPRECQNCHNNFCKKCIDLWLSQKEDLCPFRCPGKIKLNQSHKIILDALRYLKFKCKNESNGCDFLMNYDNYIEHTQNCVFTKINCTNSLCKNFLLLKDLETHFEQECEYQSHKCKICNFEYIGNKKVIHNCTKNAVKQFNDLKSEIDNFMMVINNRMNNIDDKINEMKK